MFHTSVIDLKPNINTVQCTVSYVNFGHNSTISMVTATAHFCLFRILHFHGQWSPEGLRGRAEWCSPMEGPSGLKSATWLRPLTPGPRAPGKAGKTHLGICPDMERHHFALDGPSQHGGPLAGRLPNWAKEVQRVALLEIHMQLTLTIQLKRGCFSEIKQHYK